MPTGSERKSGYIYATLAYLGWGFFPIYWKFLKHVPALEILCHRVIWAFAFYCLILFIKERSYKPFWPSSKKLMYSLLLASALIMCNWFVYIYAVNSGQVVESSLGYFINPLVNVAIGVLVLRERLSKLQMTATALAAVGVFIISWDQGHLPWIALFLAFSFSFYGLIKKLNPVSGLHSNQFESLVLLPISFGILYFMDHLIGTPSVMLSGTGNWSTNLLLIGGGLITGFPLIFFAEAAQRLPFYLLGFFQFLAPSLQFLSGVVLFGEPLSSNKLGGFIFIWVAGILIVFNNWISAKPTTESPILKS
jgi:chloramphenicol-sensitive protein RarD